MFEEKLQKIGWVILAALAMSVVSCSTDVKSQKSRNGQDRHRIACRNYVQRCYSRASELCPDGYLTLNRVRGRKVQDDTEYLLSIKCRSGKVFF